MTLRVGLQTAFSAKDPLDPFRFACHHGFGAFEWFADKREEAGWDFADLKPAARREVRAQAGERKMTLTVHAPWPSSPLTETGRRRILDAIEFAEDVGGVLVCVHLNLEQGIDAFVSGVAALASQANPAGIRLALENTPLTTPQQCSEVFRTLRDRGLGSAQVGLCLDIGHANLCEPTRNDYLRFLDSLEPAVPVIHLHLHENYGDQDSHLVVFTGPSRHDESGLRSLLRRLQQRGFEGAAILEQWPEPPELLLTARDRLIALDQATARPSASTRRTQNPVPTPDFAVRLADMSRQRRSWRQRLLWIRDAVSAADFAPSRDDLIDLAVYLRFIGTGAMACEEDGGHFRPSHHARAALDIERVLLGLRTPETLPLVRAILRWLPSHAAQFRSQEPLTRIRDIAHRNDIPRALKDEIKHTLQNKLHRSASPDDLVTSARLLERVTSESAAYSAEFVSELHAFHAELEEFFNAGSLESDLESLRPDGPPSLVSAIDELLERRRQLRSGSKDLGRELELACDLRGALQLAFAEAGDSRAQRMRIADIKLEELAFVLLSERIAELAASVEGWTWEPVLNNLRVAIGNMSLSGTEIDECGAIGRALEYSRRSRPTPDHDEWLRLRATLERARHLATRHSHSVLAEQQPRVERLGRLLGIGAEQQRLFCEGDLRRGIPFQISKLATLALTRMRAQLGLPSWDPVVLGQAQGTLHDVANLESLPEASDPCILLLHRAEGDERIPPRVRGIILAHDLPHLSHLAIRARQEGVAFATVEDEAMLKTFAPLAGRTVVLEVGTDALALAPSDATSEGCPRISKPPPEVPSVLIARDWTVVRLAEADLARCGAKSARLRILRDLSEAPGAGFVVPDGCILPFGTMELCLLRDPSLGEEYSTQVEALAGCVGQPSDERLGRIRRLIDRIRIPEHLLVAILGELGDAAPLFVRSSANGEDLPGFAAAGLYTTLPATGGVQLESAIRRVWSSLWTRRAVMSRRAAGIVEGQIHMAVLVQRAVRSDLSFVLHTRSPLHEDPRLAYAELAVGLGHTLASAAAPGTPYRVHFDRHDGEATFLAFASYSHARRLRDDGTAFWETVDYTKIPLSVDAEARASIVERLRHVSRQLAQVFDEPQDVEGAMAKDRIYLVQTRPQVGALGGGTT